MTCFVTEERMHCLLAGDALVGADAAVALSACLAAAHVLSFETAVSAPVELGASLVLTVGIDGWAIGLLPVATKVVHAARVDWMHSFVLRCLCCTGLLDFLFQGHDARLSWDDAQ